MCGIAGIVGFGGRATLSEGHISSMNDALLHRGPDSGAFLNASVGNADVWLGHRRLAILDLSPAGYQPMRHGPSGDVLVFNGEIYNHLALRDTELAEFDIRWQGHSDTETLLNCLVFLGLERTLSIVRGMFAFAWLNRADNKLYIARDAAGEKPLYYGANGNACVFASELKAIRAVGGVFPLTISREAVDAYFAHNFVPAPLSIYRDVFKLPPASWASLCLRTGQWSEPSRYWRAPAACAAEFSAPRNGLEGLLRRSIEQQLVADVPVGCFLSGGYDSSLVTAIAASVSATPVRTFSIGFRNPRYDEAPYAEAVSRHLRTEHHEYYVADEEVRDLVPSLAHVWDEPFADSSQIPTLILAAFARSHVTVCLSGDGGDELFGGYQRHRRFARMWPWISATPGWLLKAGQRSLCVASTLSGARPPLSRLAQICDRAAPFLEKDGGPAAFYRRFLNGAAGLQPEALDRLLPKYPVSAEAVRRGWRGAAQWMDQECYLPDDILVKVDRASMAHSLEVRVPLLDRDIIEYSWTLPEKELFDARLGGKALLKRLTHNYIPRELMDRPKRGFAVPMNEWLLGPLRPWAESMVGVVAARPDIVDAEFVHEVWNSFTAGRSWLAQHVWSVLMLGAWLDHD